MDPVIETFVVDTDTLPLSLREELKCRRVTVIALKSGSVALEPVVEGSDAPGAGADGPAPAGGPPSSRG